MMTLFKSLVLSRLDYASQLWYPIMCTNSERRDQSCVVSHVNMGRLGMLSYNNFRWRSIRMFNKSSCSADKFKSQLDKHLRNIVDLPCQSG